MLFQLARSLAREQPTRRYPSEIVLRRLVRKPLEAPALHRLVAELSRQPHRALEVEAGVVLLGESDRAMQLNDGLGDGQRGARRVGFQRRGERRRQRVAALADLIEQ